MRITSSMIRQMQEALGPGTRIVLDIHPGGCRVTAEWNKGLNSVGAPLIGNDREQLPALEKPKMQAEWDRLIHQFVTVKNKGRIEPSEL